MAYYKDQVQVFQFDEDMTEVPGKKTLFIAFEDDDNENVPENMNDAQEIDPAEYVKNWYPQHMGNYHCKNCDYEWRAMINPWNAGIHCEVCRRMWVYPISVVDKSILEVDNEEEAAIPMNRSRCILLIFVIWFYYQVVDHLPHP